MSAGCEQLEQQPLAREIGTRRIAEAVAAAVVARREDLLIAGLGRIGEAPLGAQLAVQPLGGGLGGLERERRQRVALEVLALFLPAQRELARRVARGGHEQREVVLGQHEVGEAEAIAGGLAREHPAPELALAVVAVDGDALVERSGREEAPHHAQREARARLLLHLVEHALELAVALVAFGLELLDRSAQAEVLAVEHLRIDQRPHLVEVGRQHVTIEVGRPRRREVAAHRGGRARLERRLDAGAVLAGAILRDQLLDVALRAACAPPGW